MKRYFKNIWLALTGRCASPEEVEYWKEMHCSDLADKKSYQTLIEQLRMRIKEKDSMISSQGHEFRERMDRMKADYQKRIEEYNQKIEELQKRLSKGGSRRSARTTDKKRSGI